MNELINLKKLPFQETYIIFEMKVKNIKRSIKNSKQCNVKESTNSFETSNIRFGKLDIVLKSYNSVPTTDSFYNNVTEISNGSIKNIVDEQSQTKPVMFDSVFDQNVSSNNNIIPVSINPRLLLFNENSNTSLVVTCWWCRLSVIPVTLSCFLPINYDELRNRYTKHGYFCSWECAKSFNFDINDIQASYRSYLIQRICRNLYGIKDAHSIKYAPHWSELKNYGGNVDNEIFLNKFKRTNLDNIGRTRDSIQ